MKNWEFKMLVLSLVLIIFTSGLNLVHAGVLSSEVIPTESRRQGLAQDNPCPGDLVKFTCILNNTSAVTVRWTANGMIQYTLSPATDVGIQRSSVTGLNATFTNTTTSTLIVDLSKSIVITNGTEVGCVEVVGVGEVITSTETVEIIGPAAAPLVAVRPGGLSTITVDITAPVYGRECVDYYRGNAVVGERILTRNRTVTDPNQALYTIVFPGVDLCGDILNNVTAVGVTDGREGTSSTPFTMDVFNRSRIITSAISASHSFTSSGIRVTLDWQVIDRGIMSNGFNATCWLGNTSLACNIVGVTANQMNISLPLLDAAMEGQAITFNVGYIYELCVNDILEAILTVSDINSSLPQEKRVQRAVTVEFDESLFDANAVKVNFSSNCTSSVTMDYSNPFVVTIPDTGLSTGLCQYNIQLVDLTTATSPIGYAITGSFNADGLPPPPTTPPTQSPSSESSSIVGAAAGGAVGGVVFIVVIIGGAGGGYAFFRYMKKKKGDSKKNDTDLGGSPASSNLIKHETAPGGEEYALVPQKTSKSPPSVENQPDSFYQDPTSIQHQTAPTGDVYAVTEKKPKKKGPTEAELAQMYSVPDKSKAAGLTYASLDMPGGGGGSEASKRSALTEYATVIN